MQTPQRYFFRSLGWLFSVCCLALLWSMANACDPSPSGEKQAEGSVERTESIADTPQEPASPEDGSTETTSEPPPPDTLPEGQPDTPQQTKVETAASGLNIPLDSTPSPDGKVAYYTAILPPTPEDPAVVEGQGALFKIETGQTPQMLAKGFYAPLGVVISTNGQTLFVADTGNADAEQEAEGTAKSGGVFTVPAAGGQPTLLAGTEGYRPRGLDLVKQNNEDILFFTGTDPSDNTPGVFRINAAGGTIQQVTKGGELRDPSGVAVAADGTVFIADAATGESSQATIYKWSQNQLSVLIDAIRVGYPAGIALTRNEDALLVSALQNHENSSAVYVVKIADGTFTIFNQGISQNSESGGVHRAHNANLFSWADSSAPDAEGKGGGSVYIITLP